MAKRVTLRDVAAEAGVSLATVDRVLNGRMTVRADTVDRVKRAMETLHFPRAPLFRTGMEGRDYRFHFIIPRGPKNTFMVNMKKSIEEMRGGLFDQNVFLDVTEYTELDEDELTSVLNGIGPGDCTGVGVIAIESVSVREAIAGLVRRGVGVATMVSDIAPSSRHYSICPNNVAAGRVAASLMGKFNRGRTGHVAVIIGAMTLRDQADRRVGFEQVMVREYPDLQVVSTPEGRDDSTVTRGVVQQLLSDYPDLVGLYNIGAGNRGIIETLEASGRQHDIVAIAHELTGHSRRALIAGTFDALLNQSFAHEVSQTVQALKAFADGDTGFLPASVPTDIYLRDNLP